MSVGLLDLPQANAADTWIDFQTSPADLQNSSGLDPQFDLTDLNFGIETSYPNSYEFFLNFVNPVTDSQFATSSDVFGSILLDLNNDGKIDYSLETDGNTYSGSTPVKGVLVDRRNGHASASSICEVSTWTNLDKQANWIGFTIPKDCLPFASSFSVRGYVSGGSGATNNDYAPDNWWQVTPGASSSGSGGGGASISSQTSLPTLTPSSVEALSPATGAPGDLPSLAAKTTKSVVTVFCGNGLGSGWAVDVQLPQAMTYKDYQSYVITNYHVIANCTDGSTIKMVTSDGKTITGVVWGWNQTKDVAGIAVTSYLPPLKWRGKIPAQGLWVGVLGSPLGHPGILTTGIVSSVQPDNTGTTSAPINHGNSGGPVFDNNGRVIGLATAIYLDPRGNDAQGFGIFNGTPLLCGSVISCDAGKSIWTKAPGGVGLGSGIFLAIFILLLLLIVGIALGYMRHRKKTKTSFGGFNYQQSLDPYSALGNAGSMPNSPGGLFPGDSNRGTFGNVDPFGQSRDLPPPPPV
jgi:Trypsin-like peptidase domain